LGGLNLYRYALNNPLRLLDEDGLNPGPIDPGKYGPAQQVDIVSGNQMLDDSVLFLLNTAVNGVGLLYNATYNFLLATQNDVVLPVLDYFASDDFFAITVQTPPNFGPYPWPDDEVYAGAITLERLLKEGKVTSCAIEAKGAASNYRAIFFGAYPELKGEVVVHHAIEQQVLKLYPGRFTAEEINSLENLRGIPKDANSVLHLSEIRMEWNKFYRGNPDATRAQIIQAAERIDRLFGNQFVPEVMPEVLY